MKWKTGFTQQAGLKKMTKMKIEILGSGTSMGVPMAGCECRVCRSSNPKDKRLRTSAYLEIGETHLLIDTSLDYRQQMLRSGVKCLHAVLFTHHHVDHILGLDDLRSFNFLNKCAIPLYGMAETLHNIKRVFTYAFSDAKQPSGVPRLTLHTIDAQPFIVRDVNIIPIPLMHGKMPVLGYRIGNFAYCTDVNHIPAASYELLQGLEILILDALREKPHSTHFTIEEAVQEALKIGAKQTYFTHLSHAIMHDETEAKLPDNIHLAYDGLKFELEVAQ